MLLTEVFKSFHIEKNFSAQRPFNRRARRAGAGQTVKMNVFFERLIWTARCRALPETVKVAGLGCRVKEKAK